MPKSSRAVRAAKAGGPPAVITASVCVGASGVAVRGIEARTDPVASGAVQAIGAAPETGPVVSLVIAVLILAVVPVVPGLFENYR
jgi:hypothetical protein